MTWQPGDKARDNIARFAAKRRPPQRTPRAQRAAVPSRDDAATIIAAKVDTAMREETAAVAQAPEGTRNDRLNTAAYNLGQLVGAAVLGESEVVDALTAAAHLCGLHTDRDCGERGIAATIDSGLKAGIAQPRDLAKMGVDDNEIAAARAHTNGSAPEPALPEPALWWATALRPSAPMRWLAKNRIPRGALTLIIGEEGIGKSLLWVWLTAAITTGSALPGFGLPKRPPGHVIIAAISEDDWSAVVRPRLEVAGARLSNIRVVCTEDDGSGAPVFPRDMPLLREADPPADLIVVDAWLDTVPATLQVRDPQQARLALHPWKELATVTNAAVALICHTNRVATPSARDRYGASSALRQKARMSLYCLPDEFGNLVAGPEKANSAAMVKASVFVVKPVRHHTPDEDSDGTVPLLVYHGEAADTVRERVADAYSVQHDFGNAKADAIGWLAAYLGEGPQWANNLFHSGEAHGFSKDQLKRAKPRLRIESVKDSATAAWFWRLPQHEGSTPRPVSPRAHPCSLDTSPISKKCTTTTKESVSADTETRTLARSLQNCEVCGQELLHPSSKASGICGRCEPSRPPADLQQTSSEGEPGDE